MVFENIVSFAYLSYIYMGLHWQPWKSNGTLFSYMHLLKMSIQIAFNDSVNELLLMSKHLLLADILESSISFS